MQRESLGVGLQSCYDHGTMATFHRAVLSLFPLQIGGETARILWLAGLGLLILGGIAGGTLFLKAAFLSSGKNDFGGRDTLWGLFILGTIAGLFLIISMGRMR